MKAWMLKKKPRGSVDQYIVANSHHFDEEPDPDLLKSRIRISINVKRDIRIHIK
jgi:hypothetical protein